MEIYGPHSVHGPQSIGPPHVSRAGQTGSTASSTSIQDELTISDAAQALEKAQQLPDVRADVVARIRSEIAAGTYETPEKLELALERLLDEIG